MLISLARELLRRDDRARALRLAGKPAFEALRIDQLDHMGGLIVICFEQLGIIGHGQDSGQGWQGWKAPFSPRHRLHLPLR